MINSRLAALASLAAMLTVPAAVISAGPAHAATTYTWTKGIDVQGADHHSWTDPRNWSPQGVPTDGDSVVVPAIASQGSVPVDNIPAVTLQDLTVAGSDTSHVFLGTDGESVTVDGTFTWTGGRITSDLTLAGGATGSIAPGAAKDLWGDLTLAGSLTLDGATVQISWEHAITVADGGTLHSTGTSEIDTNRCCGAIPSRLLNHGSVQVGDGVLTLRNLGLDQQGTLHVEAGAAVEAPGGPARLGPGAVYTGGGRLSFDHTTAPDPDLSEPDLFQGGAYLVGGNELGDGFTLGVDTGSYLTGTGSVSGSGTLDLSGATVYADVTLGPDVRTLVTGTDTTRFGVWNSSDPGYHARVVASGPVSIGQGSELDTDTGTALVLSRGASLRVPGGATLGAGTCCSDVPQLVASTGSHLELGGGADTAKIRWVNISDRATTSVNGHVTVTEGAFEQHGGTTTLDKGAVLALEQTHFTLAGGTLAGIGSVNGAVVNSGGSVAPGTDATPARLTVGSYRQTATGTLTVDVNRTRADRLVVGHTAHLDGRLAAAGAAGARGTRVTVVSAARRRGTFARTSVGSWHVRYSRTAVSLTR